MIASFEGPHDGTVSLAETLLDAESDRWLFRVSHAGLLFSPEVARQISHFLALGAFKT